jgi:isoquinoline 1-oxidoreductase subunit beta
MTEEKKKGSTRRTFLKRSAIVLGTTIVGTYLGRSPIRRFIAQNAEATDLPSIINNFKPDFWFSVLPDNTILMKSPKIEMGQGILTGFAQLAAEELEIPYDRIKVEHHSTGSGVVDALGTGGSNSTLSLYEPIREVAATMREMLKTAAANIWGVTVDKVQNTEGVLSVGINSLTYAEVVAKTKEWKIPKLPALKPENQFKYVGKSVKRVDLVPKVMGTAAFTIDKTLPNMLHAVRLECPYIDGKIKTIDTSEAEKSPDVVKVVRDGELVAVVAKTRFAATRAIDAIKVEWDVPKKWQQADIEALVTVGKGNKVNVQKDGSAKSIIESGGNIFKQEYRTPMAAHAPMEPNGTVAHVEGDKATVITGTQMPGALWYTAAWTLDIDRDKLDIQVPYLGGGFGRKSYKGNTVETVKIAKAVGKPVKMIFTREQEFQNSMYRPNTHHVLQAKINNNGQIEAITHDQATPDMALRNMMQGNSAGLNLMGADFISAGHGSLVYYDGIPNIATTVWHTDMPYLTGIWRSVGIFPNIFAIETFINELAHKMGKDPIALRLELFSGDGKLNPRFKKVLETARDSSGWNTPKAAGIGRGMAIGNDRKSIAATVVEVALENGQIRVKKATQVLDAGKAINPEGIKQQMEGCVMMGISAALYEEIQIKDGQIGATNYHEYPMATLTDTPDIQCVIIENAPEPYGVGEPPLAPVAPAIAAAIFDLTGQWLRRLPLKLV